MSFKKTIIGSKYLHVLFILLLAANKVASRPIIVDVQREDTPSMRPDLTVKDTEHSSLRGLQQVEKSSVEVVATWTGHHAVVRVTPSFVDVCPDEGDEEPLPIRFFFAEFTDPFSEKMACAYARDINTCYSMDILVKCDPYDSTGEVNLYARAFSLSPRETVGNPKRSRSCFPQDFPIIGRSRTVQEIQIDCGDPSKSLQCTKDFDCPDGTHCYEPDNGEAYCTPLSKIGDRWYPIKDDRYRPDADPGYPCEPGAVTRTTTCTYDGKVVQSQCLQPGADCFALDDPSCDSNIEYCDLSEQKCIPHLQEGDCCYESAIQCLPGLQCIWDDISDSAWEAMCRVPCTSDADCRDFVNGSCGRPGYINDDAYGFRDDDTSFATLENYCL